MDHVWFYKAVWNDAFVFWEFDLLDLQADVDLFDPPFCCAVFQYPFLIKKESFVRTLFQIIRCLYPIPGLFPS